ncbi:LamG-like jellyroll fold domain-containing protein [Sphaerisporangium sp. TRM90804]|uniref:LamG-like jellyroll fold domain-containing protein n=1 Tax=Sphaerisporangium sp. TRM90804 TaxID=3031113 RepID=UPI00244764BC|nr:LamG-like jellyroll fold domain-containing protein [Sphaerisporangium sp. TRM90804]MDH2428942.1 PKD domain-containing protein [Sphaerisporangium sp. TRM90804]
MSMKSGALRRRLVVGALAAIVTAFTVASPDTALADVDPLPGVPETVTADDLPTWQVNGVVWKMATVGTTVYAVGGFSKARPPGTNPGSPQEVNRANILAFDITTGNLLPFNHTLNAQARTVVASPDGSKIYVGGDFTSVDGQTRNRLAAFDTATGALDPAFAPSVGNIVRGITVSDDTVYFGGNFFSVNGQSRSRLGAVARSNGANRSWAPTTDDEVYALLMSPDDSRVIVGGKFQSLNGATRVGVGAVDPVTGASLPWSSNPIPARVGTSWSATFDLTTDGTNVYAAANGEGGHWFDGRYAVEPNTGDLIWLDNCYGASYGVFTTGGVLYSVSHAHDCSSLGAFPETSPTTWHRALATTTAATGTDPAPPGSNSLYSGQPIPSLLHWYPTINAGTYTGQYQGAWSVTGNSQYVVMGGEFTQVNGGAQQGLTRFATKNIAPQDMGPRPAASLTPSAVSFAAGTARVTWQSTWDEDNEELTYEVLRDGGSTPIGTVTARSSFWKLPTLGYIDTGVAPDTSHTYRVRVKDPSGNQIGSGTSASVTIASGTTGGDYTEAVAGDDPAHFWRLGEASGTAVYDHTAFYDMTANAGVTRGASGAIGGDTDGASTFAGDGTGFAAPAGTEPPPPNLTIEAWVRTTSTSGGKIVGYGGSSTGNSSNYDRHIYMDNAGRIWFGLYPNAVRTVNSSASFNDGQYHHVVATLSATAGMALFVDGKKVGQNASTVSAQNYSGYWRIGGDNLNGWPNQPSSMYLAGDIDDVAIYPAALPQAKVIDHYVASGRTSPIPPAPADVYGKAVYNDDPTFYYRLGESSGTVAADAGKNVVPGTYTGSGVTYGTAGAVVGTADTAVTLAGGRVASTASYSNPSSFAQELWFKTTTTAGGKLIGFGNVASGTSGNYDRHVYMRNDGKLVFGTYTGAFNLITSANSYNDGTWHHMVASQGPGGMKLHVDGALLGTNPQTSAEGYTGYWRIGGDNLNAWPNRPSSDNFAGSIDEVAVYPVPLTDAEVTDHWQKGSGTGPPNQVPVASFTSSCTALGCSFDASASSDADGTIAGYAWDFGDGGTATGATATHPYPAAGDYTVTLTVTDDLGGTDTETEVVVPRPPANPSATLVTDAFGRTVAGGLGSAQTGGAYTLSGAAGSFSVDGSAAKLGLPSTGANRRAYLNSVSSTRTDGTFTFSSDKAATGNGVYVWNVGRAVSGAGDYRARVRLLAGGGVGLLVSRTDAANTETALVGEQTVSGLTYTAGTALKLRLAVTGTSPTTVAAKVWAAAGAEPASWQVSATDSTADLQVAGGAGFGTFLSGSATNAPVTVTVDDYGVTDTATAPVASFTTGCTALVCDVDASGSTAGSAAIGSHTWSYGDGATGAGATAQHTYAQAGTYTITLTVTGADGRTDVTTRQVTVP